MQFVGRVAHCDPTSLILSGFADALPDLQTVEKAKQFVDKMLKTAKPAGRSNTRYFQF